MDVIYIPRYGQFLIFPNGITVKAAPVHIDKHAVSLNDEVCKTCKYRYLNKCAKLDDIITLDDFVCDFYKRKRSGAYRRKRAKENKQCHIMK